MSDEFRTYEIQVKRFGLFRWRYWLIVDGSGRSGPEHQARTRRGAIRKARRRLKVDDVMRRPWERVESGLFGFSEEEE